MLLLCACGSREADPLDSARPPAVPLDARLARFARLHTMRDIEGLRPFFATGAFLHSPMVPRGGNVDAYLRALLAEPFNMRVEDTRVLTADAKSARTRSRVQMFSPARFSLDERMDVQWVFEGGDWRIVRLEFPDWPRIVGVWKRAGLRGEPGLELRILPGGTYLIFADKDRSAPGFRGTWSWANGALTLSDSSALGRAALDGSPGVYAVVTTRSTAEFRLLADDNRWRSARFPGIWTAGQ